MTRDSLIERTKAIDNRPEAIRKALTNDVHYPRKRRISLSLDSDLVVMIDKMAATQGKDRSKLINGMLRTALNMLQNTLTFDTLEMFSKKRGEKAEWLSMKDPRK